MGQAQYLNGYDDGYADAMKKIKASPGQGGGSDSSSSSGMKLFVVTTNPAELTLSGDSIPPEGAIVAMLFESGVGKLIIDGKVYLKGSGESIFMVEKSTADTYTVTLFDGGYTISPGDAVS